MGPTRPCYGEGREPAPAPAVLTPLAGGASGGDSTPSGTREAVGSTHHGGAPAAPVSLVLAPGVEAVPGYRLIERLGRGGYGEVWKAIGPGEFQVALKFVSLAGQTGPVELRSLNLIKNIRHPHLLTIFGSWEFGGYLILAMELAECTLQDRLNESLSRGEVGIPGPELVQALMDGARGLDYLNEPRHRTSDGGEPVGIQHRDIKPHNLLLVGGCVKVADFGLARILRGTHTGHTGSLTPSFAAPEFFRNETSRHSDQYSLAVTYCVLRGGHLPFSGTIEQIIAGHLMNPPDLSMMPEAERPAVARALAKDPAERYPSCRAFVEELRSAPSLQSYTQETTRPHPELIPAVLPGPTTELASEPATPPPHRVGLIAKGLVVSTICASILFTAYAARDRRVPTPPPPTPARERPVEETSPEPALAKPGLIRRLDGDVEPAACLSISPDGRTAISGDQGGRMRSWDLESGRTRSRTRQRADRSVAAAFLSDGRRVVTAAGVNPFIASDESLRSWDTVSGAETSLGDAPPHSVNALVASANGRRLLSGGRDGTLWIRDLDLPARGRLLPARSGAITSLAITADGSRALSGTVDGSLLLWDLNRGEVEHRLTGHRSGILAVGFLPGEERAFSASATAPFRDEAPTMRLWDLSAAGERSHSELPAGTTCVAFATEAASAILGLEDGTVRLWEVEAGRERLIVGKDQARVTCVAITADARQALSANAEGAIQQWRVKP